MAPSVTHDSAARRFAITGHSGEAVLRYDLEGSRMIITHTYVPPEWRGRGVAADLVVAALNHARAAGWKVVPQCSYVDVFLRRHPEVADLRSA
jgi:predicted GNAT family acetyltransferase